MGLASQISVLFTVFIVTSQALPDDTKTTTDPGVFEMPTPPGFMRFFPTNKDETENPVKFHFWSSHIGNDDIMKFPDWFHYNSAKPEEEVKVDKNADKVEPEKAKNPNNNYMSWQDAHHDMFAYVGGNDDKNDAKNMFPPYYNVFVSNAYPSWMAMPGSQNSLSHDSKGEDLKIKSMPVAPAKIDAVLPVEKAKLRLDDKAKTNDDINVEKLSDITVEPLNLKISKNINKLENDKVSQDPHPILYPEDKEDIKVEVKGITKEKALMQEPNSVSLSGKLADDKSKVNSESVTVPIQVMSNELKDSGNQGDTFENMMFVPIALNPSQDGQAQLLTPHSSEENLLDKSKPVDSKDQNEEWKNILLNLLQNAKPIFASMSSKDTTLANTPQLAAMLIPLKEDPKPQGRSVLSGNNVLINNADDRNKDHNMNPTPLPALSPNAPPHNIPNNLAGNQMNVPNNGASNQLNNPNPGSNVPPSFPPYTNPVNQNNFLPNSGRPIYLTFPYNSNNMPQNNYMLTPVNLQGNANGQLMQANPTPNQMGIISPGPYPGYNNNNMGQAPGMHLGQNLYAMVPVANPGNMNQGGNSYLGNNPQLNPGYQVVGSVPVYNLVPANKVMNTKDEVDE